MDKPAIDLEAVRIRDERHEDIQAIYELTKMAFASMPFSTGDEQELINALRMNGALAVSLVAELQDEIIGHIAFSPVILNGVQGRWFGLGPVSVTPPLQSCGIGSKLINQGLARIRRLEAEGCVLLGDPSYYGRFGFRHDPNLTFAGEVNVYFQHLTFVEAVPTGSVTYHPAFGS